MFVLLVDYTRPMDEVEVHTAAHRAHLGAYYDAGKLLASGRCEPLTGGVILAVGTRSEMEQLAADDPFVLEGVAKYTIIEFHPNRATDDVRELLAAHGVTI
jgi:uncharacterized protein YciI